MLPFYFVGTSLCVENINSVSSKFVQYIHRDKQLHPLFYPTSTRKKTTRKKNLIPSYEINGVQLSTVINNSKQMQIFHADNFKL